MIAFWNQEKLLITTDMNYLSHAVQQLLWTWYSAYADRKNRHRKR